MHANCVDSSHLLLDFDLIHIIRFTFIKFTVKKQLGDQSFCIFLASLHVSMEKQIETTFFSARHLYNDIRLTLTA